MHPYPHTYAASATASDTEFVTITSPGLPSFQTAPPPEFDGPGGAWSPESLLCASLADCFVLTFRAIARAARLEWLHLECRVEGILERIEGTSQFTRYKTLARLQVRAGTDLAKAHSLSLIHI